MPDLNDFRREVGAARAERDAARSAQRESIFALHRAEEAIASAGRSAAGSDHAAERLTALVAEREKIAAAMAGLDSQLVTTVERARRLGGELLGSEPQDLIGQIDDDVPILLLPVRIETRFKVVDDAQHLLIRIFPDDIAIAHHEKALTVAEVEAGKTYWGDRCRANAEPDGRERDRLVNGAWSLLASRHGAPRARWIMRALKPENFTDQLSDAGLAQYPDVPTKPMAWSEAPRSFVLPERFVVRLFAGGSSRDVSGGLVPDDLAFGPDPLREEDSIRRDETTGTLTTGIQLRWMTDFDRAVEVGMALKVPLELPRESSGFERIVVIGLRLATSPHDGSALLQRLVDAHQFSEGIAVLAQGTATNNTDRARSGLATPDEDSGAAFEGELTSPADDEDDHHAKTDGQRLAEAFGLPSGALARVPGHGNRDIAEGLAMNRVLWSATMGSFLSRMFVPGFGSEMTEPLLDAGTIGRVRNFFANYVTGRGVLPALRVGAQPYGVLVTSALTRWEWLESETGAESSFWNGLVTRLRQMEQVWHGQVAKVSHVGKDGDAFEHLLDIIGLQASSVEFFSRKAISRSYLANYLRFRNTPKAYATGLWEDMERAINGNLAGMGLPALNYALRDLIFSRDHDALRWPVIDDDPRTPFSEANPIRPFDGARNYIEWLRTSSVDEIRSQVFTAADGRRLSPPQALLYRTMRTAFLEELGRAGRSTVKTHAPHVFLALADEPPLVNIGSTPTFTTSDVLSVDASRIGAAASRISVGDHLVGLIRNPRAEGSVVEEVAALADLHDALASLVTLPTARLERLFAEHVDLCSYRLDGWVNGLFARRLLRLRSKTDRGHEASGDVQIGAFGYVEALRPSQVTRSDVSPDELPEALRPGPGVNIVEGAASGGYVHAPSLAHAVTAAVLRNGYLSHADSSRPDLMAVNLSSSRVRTALNYVDGIRNGQELAALLGYQFERGLHENHPGVELDEFIYVFRERFPFTSGKLTDLPVGTASEQMEARNVVNGYDLLEHARTTTYPYGIGGLPAATPAGTPAAARATAIRAEIDALADAMDAIADVVLSESVHQVVQGNYDRAKGVLQSISEGEAPPEFDVVRTPRSGRALTFRLALALDPTATSGWLAASTPRARADAVSNRWLTTKLPDPADIQWRVHDRTNAPAFVALETLGLEAIDVVLMAGEQLGDLSGELERLLVYDHRTRHAVPDDVVTFFYEKSDQELPDERALVIDPSRAEPGKVTLASIFPLLRALHRIITTSRTLDARDFELPIEAQEVGLGDPKGFDDGSPQLTDLFDLRSRIEAAHADLATAATALDDHLLLTIKPLHDALQADPAHVIVPGWIPALAALRDLMTTISRFGAAEALPTAGLQVTSASIEALIAQANSTAQRTRERLVLARTALDITFTEPVPADPDEAARARASRTEARLASYIEAARSVLGQSVNPLVLFRIHPESRPELIAAISSPISSDAMEIEEWAQSLVRVRQPMHAVMTVASYADWLPSVPASKLVPLQLPVRSGDKWIATTYGTALGPGDIASIVVLEEMPAPSAALCGLLIDEWTELVPTEQETSGIAFHFDRPNSEAPQVLLLAVAPRLQGSWRWEDLVATILETVDRAKRRAVEPDMLMQTAYFQGLPATLTEFSSAGLVSNLLAAESQVSSVRLTGPS